MTPIIISKTGTGRSTVTAPDSFQNPFNIGVLLTVTGTATFNLEVSMQDPTTDAITSWAVPTGFSALSAGAVLSLTVPCHAISLNITSGSGTVTAQLVQAGMR
jgi:hypothetical protein